MAGRDKERDRGHAHRSNGSKPVQAASAELARQGTEACAVYSGLERVFWKSRRFGYAAALCSTVAELVIPRCARSHSVEPVGIEAGVAARRPQAHGRVYEIFAQNRGPGGDQKRCKGGPRLGF